MQHCTATRRRTGFTLLELILTLTLAVALTAMIGEAMSFYVTNMETRDQEVRRVQLATSVMKMIGDDLKASLAIAEFDDAALAEFLSTSGAQGASAAGAGSGESEAASSMLFDVEEEEELPLDEEPLDLATQTTVLKRPGLIGNQNQILFDISRTPRLEEFQPMLASPQEGLTDVASDIKTVSYFVQPAGVMGGVVDPLSQFTESDAAMTGNSGGLVRRQLDRLVTKFALESGGVSSLNLSGDLLAPEVLAIEFAYWDGFIWQIQWNSDELGALPLAIQIRLTIGVAGADASQNAGVLDPTDTANVRVFQQTVRLPMGRIVEEEELAADDGMSGVGL